MCHQSVGLIQGALEAAGISTVGVSLSVEITRKIRPPRTLQVPYPFGLPLGAAGDSDLQTAILRAALDLLTASGPPPVTRFFSPSGDSPG